MYNLFKISRHSSIIKQLNWQFIGQSGALIKFPSNNDKIVVYVNQSFSINMLIHVLSLQENQIQLPKRQTLQSSLYNFLTSTEPQSIVFNTITEQYALLNHANNKNLRFIKEVTQNSNNIYGEIQKILPNILEIASFNKFLIRYYLKLQTQHYFRVNNIRDNIYMTDHLKQKIFGKISFFYYQNASSQLQRYKLQYINQLKLVQSIKQQIYEIETKLDKRIMIYKVGSVAFVATHLISFTYMIFFVDWLGWDIIQPLTYSMTVFYSLIGVRFYRKYRLQRSQETVKNMLRNILGNPHLNLKLLNLKKQLQAEQTELKMYQTQIEVTKNKLNFKSSLLNLY